MVHGTDGAALVASDRVLLRGRQVWPGPLLPYGGTGELTAIPRERSATWKRLSLEAELHGRFARWVDDLDGFPCPGEQALLDLRAIDALARAAKSGQREPV
jgi:predicted dehydrogenase